MNKKLTKKQKIGIISSTPEMLSAIKLISALMDDIKAKRFVIMGYEGEGTDGTKYQFEIICMRKVIKTKK